jgi:hypothetical protein
MFYLTAMNGTLMFRMRTTADSQAFHERYTAVLVK